MSAAAPVALRPVQALQEQETVFLSHPNSQQQEQRKYSIPISKSQLRITGALLVMFSQNVLSEAKSKQLTSLRKATVFDAIAKSLMPNVYHEPPADQQERATAYALLFQKHLKDASLLRVLPITDKSNPSLIGFLFIMSCDPFPSLIASTKENRAQASEQVDAGKIGTTLGLAALEFTDDSGEVEKMREALTAQPISSGTDAPSAIDLQNIIASVACYVSRPAAQVEKDRAPTAQQ